MHQSIPQQGKRLRQVVIGCFDYHVVPTNSRAIALFWVAITKRWQRVLNQHGQRGNPTWARMMKLASDWLPQPHIRHPWPNQRFAVTHPRWEPHAGRPHVRFWGAQ